ncbi:hypothetical protein ACJ41O_011129 [Fusarium nematophilum]
MSPVLELFFMNWGVYPRRILLYLAEKGLLSSPLIKLTPVTITLAGMSTPAGKPPGTVPIMKLPGGKFIKQSVAILEYLEDICEHPQSDWQEELARSAKQGSLRGETAEEKARVRDMACLADEVNIMFGFAGHKGTALFTPVETSSPITAKLALENARKNLKLLEEYYEGDVLDDRPVNIADCILYSMLHFSKDLYDLDLVEGMPNLERFYTAFQGRESARVDEDHFPQDIKELASQWLPVD